MVKPKVRFNCRPEITVFTLRSGVSGRTTPGNEAAEGPDGAVAAHTD